MQLVQAEKHWVLDRMLGVMKKNQCCAVQALRRMLGSAVESQRMALAASKAKVAGVRAVKLAAWVTQCSASLAELETNTCSAAVMDFCRAKHQNLLRPSRERIGAAVYPQGEQARVGRAATHEQGTLPAVPRTAGAPASISCENILPDATMLPSFEPFLRLVLGTEEMFGHSTERRKFWRTRTLSAAVGNGVFVADRDKLHGLLQRGASTGEISRYLEEPFIGGFTAGGSNGLLILRPKKGGVQEYRASAQVLASVLGVPLELDHPIRLGLAAVSPSQARQLMGQSMDMDVLIAIFQAELPEVLNRREHRSAQGTHSGSPSLALADLFSGISVPAAAAMRLRPSAKGVPRRAGPGQFRYKMAGETVDTVLQAHRAAWGGIVERVVQHAHSQEAVEAMRAAAPLDLAVAGVRCSPWAPCKTTKDPADPGFRKVRERALEESCQAATALAAGEPKRIILETSSFLLKGKRRPYWERLAAHLAAIEDYDWCYQVICPRKALAKWVARERLFVVGRRRAGESSRARD